MAEAARHPDAYLFIPKGAEWRETSTWERVEYPWLTQNPAIERIWRVDPRPPSELGISEEDYCAAEQQVLMWERGRDEPLSVAEGDAYNCPIHDDQ
jgi:hypothetical protein